MKWEVRLASDMSVVPTDEPSGDEHPVRDVEPEMRGSDVRGWQVQVETDRPGEWLRWTGQISWIPGEEVFGDE
jgi:hypothetical protein